MADNVVRLNWMFRCFCDEELYLEVRTSCFVRESTWQIALLQSSFIISSWLKTHRETKVIEHNSFIIIYSIVLSLRHNQWDAVVLLSAVQIGNISCVYWNISALNGTVCNCDWCRIKNSYEEFQQSQDVINYSNKVACILRLFTVWRRQKNPKTLSIHRTAALSGLM